uniref:(northern house mosquito) hypothetical protein n=1 Tax=Culex pipiens TaxID=7175 RepID=A0A8D8CCG6_CULPI
MRLRTMMMTKMRTTTTATRTALAKTSSRNRGAATTTTTTTTTSTDNCSTSTSCSGQNSPINSGNKTREPSSIRKRIQNQLPRSLFCGTVGSGSQGSSGQGNLNLATSPDGTQPSPAEL